MEEKQTGTADTVHTPVLLQQVIDSLAVRPTDTVVDGTAGGGGHARALLSALGPAGRYVAIDADRAALARVQALVGDDPRLTLVHGNFRDIDGHLASVGIDAFDKLLLDLGLSSDQLETSVRGFSFTKDEPLIMTLSDSPREDATTAWHVVNDWSEQSLADVIYGFGGERFARKIAHAIVLRREGHPIGTTKELADVIASTIRSTGRIHPATRTFQAIRIAVNDELGALEEVLHKALPRMRTGGRIAVISFHSLEDRIVKRTFRGWQAEERGVALYKRPVVANREEIRMNPRARSAKLRCFEKQD